MGYEELIRDLQRETDLKREAVLSTAREEARQIIADAMQQCDRMEQGVQESITRDLEQARTRVLNLARGEARKRLTRVKSELIQEVFRGLEARLKTVASEERYRAVLERLLDETRPEWPAGEIVIRADAGTRTLIQPLMAGRTVRFEPFENTALGEDPLGGFELADRENTIAILNTFRSRLSKARPELLVEMNRFLFG
jgi:vacuolar-type H+-ATPase subunit E/Vma4